MADFIVKLVPAEGEDPEQEITIQNVDIGFSQLGWLMFQNDRREPVAAFTPGSVRFVVRTDTDVIDIKAEELPSTEELLIN